MAIPGVKALGVTVTLAAAADDKATLELGVTSVDVPALGWHAVKLVCQGELTRVATRKWQFKGKLALRGASGAALRNARVSIDLDNSQNSLSLSFDQQGQEIHLALPLDELGHIQVRLVRLPVGWLQGLLSQIWEKGQLGKGQLGATLSVDITDTGLRSAGRYELQKTDFDSKDGSMAGQGLTSDGHWSLESRGDHSTLDLDSRLLGGEVLLGSVYAKLPDSATRVRLNADFSPAGVRLDTLHFDDSTALRFDGLLGFDSDGRLDQARIDGFRAVFPAAYQHYGKAMLAAAGFPDLRLQGMLTGSLVWNGDGWQRFAFDAAGLSVDEPSQRIGIQGLTGRLDWARSGQREPSELSWNALSMLGLKMGAASTAWRSTQGTLSLTRPVQIPIFGGQAFFNSLDWSPHAKDQKNRVAASVAYSGIDLSSLSTAFGWPAFQGTVGGAIPGLDYDGERVKLGGGVSINVFDGFVDITDLVLQHPFGAAPVLTAAIGFRNIDLKPMTQVFDFGSITGRLEGRVDDLRMINWLPVAFSADLRTSGDGRISQKAVNSISNLGGGGIAGGLQSAVLGVFDSFGYRHIGLGCVLKDDVCTMTGVGDAKGGGFTIVEGRGLPHIAVIGHQHQVDWSTLVARLKAATSGGGVEIN